MKPIVTLITKDVEARQGMTTPGLIEKKDRNIQLSELMNRQIEVTCLLDGDTGEGVRTPDFLTD